MTPRLTYGFGIRLQT